MSSAPGSSIYSSAPSPRRVFGEPLSPALSFLLLCSTPAFDENARTQVNAVLARGLDWQSVSALALRHALSQLVFTRLHALLPPPQRGQLAPLQADALALTQRALILTAEMKRLVPQLEAQGIPTLVFKGPPFALSVFGSIALRAFTDLDLMVHPAQVERAWQFLTAQGYTLAYRISPAQLPALIANGNHLPLYGSPNNELIELHWAFFPKSRATPFDTAGAWARSVRMDFDGVSIATLAPFDLVHYLCLHGVKHAWSRLGWIADLAWCIVRYPELDWRALLDHAARLGTRRITLVGLALVQELFSISPGAWLAREIARDPQVTALARWMWQRTLRGAQELPTGWELAQLVLRSRERPLDRARDGYHHLIALRPNNLEDTPPSAALHTYTLHRLWYLLRKYSAPDK